jgi:hypothetical protein
LIDSSPIAPPTSLVDDVNEVIWRCLHADAVLEHDSIDRLHPGGVDRGNARDSRAILGTVVDCKPNLVPGDKAADLDGTFRRGDKSVLGLAGVYPRPRIRVKARLDFAFGGFDIEMPLSRAGDVIRPSKACIEPLRRVRSGHLVDEHVGQLNFKCLRVIGRCKIAVVLTPMSPAPSEAFDDLANGAFRAVDRFAIMVPMRFAFTIELGYARLAEVLGNHDVRCNLGPVGRNLGIGHFKDDGANRI